MEAPIKRKVTAKVDYGSRERPTSSYGRTPISRPGSPSKGQGPFASQSSLSPPNTDVSIRPKAKVNSGASTVGRRASPSGSSSPTGRPNMVPRAPSPFKQPPITRNGTISSPTHTTAVKARVTVRPSSRSNDTSPTATTTTYTSTSSEPRQRSLTAVAADASKLTRQGQSIHRSGSFSSFRHTGVLVSPKSSSSHTRTATHDVDRSNGPQLVRVKSKISGLAKGNADSSSIPPLPSQPSSPYATTRPINTRSRAPSISSTYSPNASQPSATSSEARQRSLTGDAPRMARKGSVSQFHSGPGPSSFMSFMHTGVLVSTASPSSSVHTSTNASASSSLLSPAQPMVKVKSKITGLAKANSDSSSFPAPASTSSLQQPSSPYATTRPIHPRTRAPSISSNSNTTSIYSLNSAPSSPNLDQTQPQGQFYPITTATPAANPHRFAPNRPHQYQYQHQQPSRMDDLTVNHARQAVDPAAVPLPPQSPPTSAVSYSSHSSVSFRTSSSKSSASTLASHVNSNVAMHEGEKRRRASMLQLKNVENIAALAAAGDGDDSFTSGEEDRKDVEEISGGAEHKVKAEAKSNRKIADLEITNRSLLAINASLETTKHRQAKEIRELRRKLRESRLILPPRAYRAVKSSLDHDDTAEDDDDEEEDEEDEENNGKEGTADAAYKRVTMMIDSLLESGRMALDAKTEDFQERGKGGGAKVLHADEVRSWRHSGGEPPKRVGEDAAGSESVLLDPSSIAVPDSEDDFPSEEEVEALAFEQDSAPPAPPPITVTPSP